MSLRKWRETKQQLIWWPDLALLCSCLVSLLFPVRHPFADHGIICPNKSTKASVQWKTLLSSDLATSPFCRPDRLTRPQLSRENRSRVTMQTAISNCLAVNELQFLLSSFSLPLFLYSIPPKSFGELACLLFYHPCSALRGKVRTCCSSSHSIALVSFLPRALPTKSAENRLPSEWFLQSRSTDVRIAVKQGSKSSSEG